MALKFLQSLKEPTVRLARWILELQQYDCEFRYKKGSLQVVANALSRNIELDEDEMAGFTEIKDKWYLQKIEEVQSRPQKYKNWTVSDGMLYRYNTDNLLDPFYDKQEAWRLVVPFEYRDQVFWEAHNHILSAYYSVEKTYSKLARDFYWPGFSIMMSGVGVSNARSARSTKKV